MYRKNELIEFIRILYRKKKRGNLGDMEVRMRSLSVDLIGILEVVISMRKWRYLKKIDISVNIEGVY